MSSQSRKAALTPRAINDTGVVVSRLAIGGGPFGNLFEPVSDVDVVDIVELALARGLRHFDTAPLYGFGLAERRLGQALHDVEHDRYAISTKVGRLLRADAPPDQDLFYDGEPFFVGTPPVNPVRDFSVDGTRASFRESLERLGLDQIDIVYIHEPEPQHIAQVVSETHPALCELRRESRARAIGLGSDRLDVMVPLVAELPLDCLLLASRYSLLDHSALDELLPLCAERGLAVLAAGVFNSGILADPVRTPLYEYAPAPAEVRRRVQQIAQACERWRVPLAAAALQFPLAHPSVVSVVVGMRSTAELEQNVALLDVDIPEGLWLELKERGLIAPDAPTGS